MTEDAIRVSPRTAEHERGAAPGRGGPVARGGRGGGPARGGRGALPVTTELVVFAAVALAVLIAAAVAENLHAGRAWTLVTALAAAYILSRGLAKDEHPGRDPLD